MKLSYLGLLVLLSAALAAPAPGVIGAIDLGDLDDLPAPTQVPVEVAFTSVDLASVATSLAAAQSATADASGPTVIPLRKRQTTCKPFSNLASTSASIPSSADDFQKYVPWTTPASGLGWYGQPVYEGVNSVGPKNGLLGVYTYRTYDPSVCQAKCNSMSSCQSFAIWLERVPTQSYDASSCPNPPLDPAYQTKCLYYSHQLQTSDATNKGQWTNNRKFFVVQTGVKFFNRNNFVPKSVDGFSGPAGGYGTCAPLGVTEDGSDVTTTAGRFHVDVLALPSSPMATAIDPDFCATTCKSITSGSQADDQSGIKLNCNMFSLLLLRKNGKEAWQCQYWTKDLPDSRNTQCASNANVIASWKYVNPDKDAAPFVNTKPALPGSCSDGGSSSFGLRCLEDFNDVTGRSDYAGSAIQQAFDSMHYYTSTTKLVGFVAANGGQYWIHNTRFYQLDATYLAGTDGTFGLCYFPGTSACEWTASGFVFDLESIDMASWFVGEHSQAGDTLTLYGMRGGQAVTQGVTVQAQHQASPTFASLTGLLDLGFKKIDALKVVPSYDQNNFGYGWDFVAFDNMVLTRYAVPAQRRGLSAGKREDVPEHGPSLLAVDAAAASTNTTTS
ncbi:hypothetical protein sr15769 [Sporisorium reilianum SRZ2]|uniref:Fruiting body protein SC7 n=1 Tax=Sporisorium reilianum (strain SRZ2) TaxID=999809 RepID=E6ZPZ7_SPORE|nr:hypothetical protein sr15769 [Sporisorium reilianum SRZ2]